MSTVNDEQGLPQPGELVAGKYRVERAIGAGGMGAVYRATETRTGKVVALKCLRPKLAAEPNAAKRFVREAQASARIRHPNVVDIYGIEEQAGRIFLVFELLEGETLREVLSRGPLAAHECLALMLPVMRGVAAAHAQGVVHRDLKPENVFLVRDPDDASRRIPKLLDFGISKVATDAPEALGTLTATGAMLGTPHYMSLEQLQGAAVDERSDVYALGVVLYECLTGKRPFDGESFSAIVVKAATEAPIDPRVLRPELPRALCEVVQQAMARARDERYPSVHALLDALRPFAAEVQSAAAASASAKESEAAPEASAERRAQPQPTRTSAHRDDGAASRALARGRWAWTAGLLTLVSVVAWLLSPAGPSSRAEPTLSSPGGAASSTTAATATTTPATTPSPAREPLEPRADDLAPPARGSDTRPTRSGGASRFGSGWVYLGNYAQQTWATRYFDGWRDGLPAVGSKITPRGRSYVRGAMPDASGSLALVSTTIGPQQSVKVLELSRWMAGSYVWARVEPAW